MTLCLTLVNGHAQGSDSPILEQWGELTQRIADPESKANPRTLFELESFIDEFAPVVLAEGSDSSREERKAVFRACWQLPELSKDMPPERKLEFLDLSYRIADASNLHEGACKAAGEAGRVLYSLGRNQEARELLEAACASHPQADKVKPHLLLELTEVCRLLGDTASALNYLDASEASLHEDAEYLRPSLIGLRAQIYLDLGLPDLAAPWVEQERMIAESGGTDILVTASHVHRTNHAIATGDFEGAAELAFSFLSDQDLYSRYPHRRAAMQVLRGIAESHLERVEPTRAKCAAGTLEEALAEPSLQSNERVQAELRLAELFIRNERFPEAWQLLGTTRERILEWQADATRIAPVPEYAWLTMLESRLTLAEGASEVSLRQCLERSQQAFDQFLALWALTPDRSGGIGFLSDRNRRAVVSELLRLDFALDQPEEAVEQWMRAQAMGTLARRAGLGSPTLAELRARLLAPGRGLLVFVPAPDRSLAITIDSESVTHFELSPSHVLEALCAEHMSRLMLPPPRPSRGPAATAQRDEERQAAGALSRELLPRALLTRLESWDEIYVDGLDLLEGAALASLPTPDGPYLGTQKALGTLPSLPYGYYLAGRPERGPAELDLFLLAAPSASPEVKDRWQGLPDLDLDADQLGSLTRAYDAERVRALVADRATLAQATSVDRQACTVLQFLVHGVVDPDRERPVGLVLAPRREAPTAPGVLADAGRPAEPSPALMALQPEAAAFAGVLWTDEMDHLDSPPFVMLTACRSGAGTARKGDEGITRMSTAWLERGARAVLDSPVNLDYAATLAFSAVFHEHLAAGDTPAEAARQARAALAASNEFAAPFYHGTLQVTGLAHERLFSR